MSSPAPPQDPTSVVRLRAATAWGGDVLGTQDLGLGEGIRFAEAPLLLPRPDGPRVGEGPLRADRRGWVLRCEGATDGRARLNGVEHGFDALEGLRLARPGDHAVLHYGPMALCFEVLSLPARRPPPVLDGALLAAAVFALVAVVGGLGLVWAVTGRGSADPPVALLDPARIGRVFRGLEPSATASSAADVAASPPPTLGEPPVAEAAMGSSPHDPGGTVRRALTVPRDGSPPAVPRDVLLTLLAHRAETERCFAGDSGGAAADGGAITVRWVVAPNGRAESMEVTRSTLALPVVERCLKRKIAELIFDRREHPTTLVHTFRAEAR